MLKESNRKVANKKIKVVNDVCGTVEEITVTEVLDYFSFSEEPLLKDVTTIYRRLDYLEMEKEKAGKTYHDYYVNIHGTWVFEY